MLKVVQAEVFTSGVNGVYLVKHYIIRRSYVICLPFSRRAAGHVQRVRRCLVPHLCLHNERERSDKQSYCYRIRSPTQRTNRFGESG